MRNSNLKYEIYVDGSHINGATGYGAVILKDGRMVDELCGPVDSVEVASTRQVAGELVAVKEALKWCVQHSISEVSIYFDYLGIEKWAAGEWKTNQPLTKDYARFVRECPIKIRWRKVNSHSGDRWNDRADALAKKGAGSTHLSSAQKSIGPGSANISKPGSAGVPPATSNESDLINELLRKTDQWIEFLLINGIEARLDRVYNEQFARIVMLRNDEPVGVFDLYNTKKKRFSPYLHNFRSEQLKRQVEALWTIFLASSG